MAAQIADATLHIDEYLEDWQRDILDEHMRMQRGVISAGHNDDTPHLMIVQYNPERADAKKFIHMLERHGYHAERVG